MAALAQVGRYLSQVSGEEVAAVAASPLFMAFLGEWPAAAIALPAAIVQAPVAAGSALQRPHPAHLI